MAKRFYCRQCANNPAIPTGYNHRAVVYLEGGELQYFCERDRDPVEIVDKPCDHKKWKLLKYSANEEGSEIAILRQCTECEQKQHNWVQVGWSGDGNVNE